MTAWIYPCPDCNADLDNEGDTQCCPVCGAIYETSWFEEDADADDQRDLIIDLKEMASGF